MTQDNRVNKKISSISDSTARLQKAIGRISKAWENHQKQLDGFTIYTKKQKEDISHNIGQVINRYEDILQNLPVDVLSLNYGEKPQQPNKKEK